MLLLLAHLACQRHHYQSEYVHFGFLKSQTEEIQLEITSLSSTQPIEDPQLTPQSNFWTLRGLEKLPSQPAISPATAAHNISLISFMFRLLFDCLLDLVICVSMP